MPYNKDLNQKGNQQQQQQKPGQQQQRPGQGQQQGGQGRTDQKIPGQQNEWNKDKFNKDKR